MGCAPQHGEVRPCRARLAWREQDGGHMEQPDDVRATHGDGGTGAARRAGRRGGPLLWMSMAMAAGLVVLLVVAVLRPAEDSPLTALNRPAPNFTLSLYGGGELRLAGLRGKTG